MKKFNPKVPYYTEDDLNNLNLELKKEIKDLKKALEIAIKEITLLRKKLGYDKND